MGSTSISDGLDGSSTLTRTCAEDDHQQDQGHDETHDRHSRGIPLRTVCTPGFNGQ